MKFTLTQTAPNQEKADCLMLGVYADQSLTKIGTILNKATNQYLSKFIKSEQFKGEPGKTLLIHHIPGIQSARVLLVGLGDKAKLDQHKFAKAIKTGCKAIKTFPLKNICCYLTDVEFKPLSTTELLRIAVISASNAFYQFDHYKSEKQPLQIQKIAFYCDKANTKEKTALTQGEAIAHGVAFAQDLGNQPSNICTPTYLAEQAKQLSKGNSRIKVEILDAAKMKKLGMGALLGVGQGSSTPPKLIIVNYQGGKKTDNPIVLVGKGITFDTGGISIKPADGMEEMKGDMMGAASVLGVIKAINELALPINVVGLVPTAENMPDGGSYKPGDILTSLSGQTIEVLNTDAEGRLILCDALTYAKRFNPKIVIDIATLTGAMAVALGLELSGIIANDDTLAKALVEAGDKISDRAWHMPLVEDYQRELDSAYADTSNCGSRWGGAITAALFLARFTKDYRWAHIDNAGSALSGYDGKGMRGRPIALLVNYLLTQC